MRRRAGGRRVYGADELERLRFIQRLKALGPLARRDPRAERRPRASAARRRAMLERLDELLGQPPRRARRAHRASSRGLRDEIEKYRDARARAASARCAPREGEPR